MRSTFFVCVLLPMLIPSISCAQELGTPRPVITRQDVELWIDTDPGCGLSHLAADVDDCLALEVVRRLKVKVVGISSTSGNVSARSAWNTLQRWKTLAPLYRGGERSCTSPAVRALVQTLKNTRLRILALGPLTNIAQAVICQPDIAHNIKEIIFVGGRFRHERFRVGSGSRELRDLNYELAPDAFQVVWALQSPRVAITLVPFRVGNKIRLRYAEVYQSLDPKLRESFARWSRVMKLHGSSGIPPFDIVALAYVLNGVRFECKKVDLEATQKNLRTAFMTSGDGHAHLCDMKDPNGIKALVLEALQQRPI